MMHSSSSSSVHDCRRCGLSSSSYLCIHRQQQPCTQQKKSSKRKKEEKLTFNPKSLIEKKGENLHLHHPTAQLWPSESDDSSWKLHSDSSTQLWDDHNNQAEARRFNYKAGFHNPWYIRERPRRWQPQLAGMLMKEAEAEDYNSDGEVCAWQKEDKTKDIHNKVHQEEEDCDYQRMQHDTRQARNLVALLKSCANKKDLHTGSKLHADILRLDLLEKNIYIGNSLVSMYAKCGALAKAQDVCDKLPVRNVVSWNALIAGYIQHGHGEQALKCYEQMQLEGLSPDAFTFACALKACGSLGVSDKGQELHTEIVVKGLLGNDIIVGTALVDMYVKCGLLAAAQEVFDQLPARDVVLWSALIAGYAQHGHGKQALKCYERMKHEGLSPNAVTFVCALTACGSTKAADKGQEIHAEIARQGFLEKDTLVGNALVDMYAKCGLLAKAQEVFDKLPVCNVVTWNVLITGYVLHGHGEQALKCYEEMKLKGFSPDSVTFVCILKACGCTQAADKGQEIHAEILRDNLLQDDIVVGTALVDMYAKCGWLAKAQEVFDKLPPSNLVLWNALIAGYTHHGHGEKALKCFEQMQLAGLCPNAVTFICILKACGSSESAVKGQQIHAKIVREGLLEKDIIVGTVLVDMYSKCGLLAKAKEVFDQLPVCNAVTWNVLISGYVQHGQNDQALMSFDQMQYEGVSPDAATFAYALKACGSIGAADKGRLLHIAILKEGLLEKDYIVGNALVYMYAKCGLLEKAQEVFDKLSRWDVISWSALLAGYALLGKVEHVFHCFDKMIEEGMKPDLVMFTTVLNACSHAGLLDKGLKYFESMKTCYGISPMLEHHTCMVNLFARAGHLEKAVTVIKEMPFPANLTMWHIILGACRKWANLKLGRLAFEQAVRLDEKDAEAYVCMSNIYIDAGRQDEADKVEAIRVRKAGWKKPGLQ